MDILSSDSFKKRGYFNQDKINEVIHDHMTGKQDHHLLLYGLLLVELWHRQFVD
jgi:hypothetical protein